MAFNKIESTIENAGIRSGYGDMHMHKNTASMVAHVANLCAHGQIDEAMAAELLKP